MRRGMLLSAWVVVATVAVGACGPRAGTLEGAAAALGTASMNAIEFSGIGPMVPVRAGAKPDTAMAAVRRLGL